MHHPHHQALLRCSDQDDCCASVKILTLRWFPSAAIQSPARQSTCRMDPRISIVIPCRNDAVALRATLDGVSRLQGAHAVEAIVAAAGDEARTLEAAAGRARVVWPGGATRAELLNAGGAVARAPVLLFLHADSHLPTDAVALVESALRDPAVLSGAFEHSFSEPDWPLRTISAINRLRYRATRNYYGDQGQFVRTEVFRAIGGFPTVTMMEDLALSQRLKRLGRTVLVRVPLQTSGRRFLQRGPWQTLVQCGLLIAIRACGADVDRYSEFWRGPENEAPGSPVCKGASG